MQENKIVKTYLVTGAAGFIGYHLSLELLKKGCRVVGFDNLNGYYDVSLKNSRLELLMGYKTFNFIKGDLSELNAVDFVFNEYKPDIVINLAAQAGVRYSIENPHSYMQSNMVGFLNILECCRHHSVEHLVYASSSSVYGNQKKVPYSISDNVDSPISLYAATKKSNELMAYTYSHLYGIPTTGLRFFTVYGPLGRPDMAYFKFTNKIFNREPIQIFNNGDMFRDFTYVDDIVFGIEQVLSHLPKPDDKGVRYKLYNIGGKKPENLLRFISVLEDCIGLEADKEFLPMQPGDVYMTCADTIELEEDFDFKPKIPIEDGLSQFVKWYRGYYNK